MSELERGKFVPFDAYEENPLENVSIGLEDTIDFEGLYSTLESQGIIKYRHKDYTPGRLRVKIENVRHGHEDLLEVPDSYGLRKAVERLLQNDKVYKKYISGSKAKKRKK